MATVKYSDISPRTTAYAVKKYLEHAMPVEVLSRFGDVKPMPKNATDQVKFRRPVPFSAATTPLTEGVTPSGGTMSYEDVSGTLAEYGDFVEITDVIEDTHEDPVLQDIVMLSGEQAALTKEMLIWGALKAGTNKYYSNGSARALVNTPPTLTMQRKITRGLKAQKAQKVTQMVSASPNYSTEPVAAAYICVAHTDLEGDIRDMTNFTPTEKYGSMKALPNEIGKVEDVRYLLSPELAPYADAGAATSTMISTTGANADVYPMIYFGKNAYGSVALRGKNSAQIMVLNPGVARGGDPLGQRGTIGWKAYNLNLILNQAWMAVAEVAATA